MNETDSLLWRLDTLFAHIEDMAQELAVMKSLLEEARKQLNRYEGGTK